MAIFNLFNKRNENEGATELTMEPVALTAPKSSEEIINSKDDDEKESSEKNTLTVSYATGWPIDVIYGYLHKNYEEEGFNDAMVKSDMAFRDMKMSIIRNKILMVFREINLNYDVMKQDIDTRMETCTSAGLLTTVAELGKQMSIIRAHKEELAQLEQDFRNNTNEASVPLQSYNCGFLRGIATIAMGSTQKATKKVIAAPTRPAFHKDAIA